MYNVLHVIDEPGPGGKWNGVITLCRAMDGRYFRSFVTSSRECDLSVTGENNPWVPVEWGTKSKWDIKAIIRLASIERNMGAHIVHSHGRRADFAAAMAVFLNKTPALITTLHEPMNRDMNLAPRNDLFARFYSAMLKARFDKILTVSESTAREAVDSGGLPSTKVASFKNGIDIEKFNAPVDRDGVRRELNLSPEDRVIIWIGHLAPRKDPECLFRAVRKISKDFPIRVIMVGDGVLRDSLKMRIREWGIEESVRFVGRVSETVRYIKASDIFVLTSRMEGLSRSLLEAMAGGLPAIATDAGGAPEVIEHGVNGLIVPVGDDTALADSIRQLISNPGIMKNMAELGMERVRREYTAEIMAKQTAEHYLEALRKKGF